MNESHLVKQLLHHPFWHNYLSVESDYIQQLSMMRSSDKRAFLNEIVKGFYPLSKLSAPLFKKLSEILDSKLGHSAHFIYETELGLHPLVDNPKYYKIAHADQFFLLCESLITPDKLEKPYILEEEFFSKINLEEAGLEKILAMVNVIEHNGPDIIYHLDDLLAQWKAHHRISSRFINSHFIQEHGLIEGSDGNDQHISMVAEILVSCSSKIDQELYTQSMKKFIALYHEMLDSICPRIQKIFNLSLTCH